MRVSAVHQKARKGVGERFWRLDHGNIDGRYAEPRPEGNSDAASTPFPQQTLKTTLRRCISPCLDATCFSPLRQPCLRPTACTPSPPARRGREQGVRVCKREGMSRVPISLDLFFLAASPHPKGPTQGPTRKEASTTRALLSEKGGRHCPILKPARACEGITAIIRRADPRPFSTVRRRRRDCSPLPCYTLNSPIMKSEARSTDSKTPTKRLPHKMKNPEVYFLPPTPTVLPRRPVVFVC